MEQEILTLAAIVASYVAVFKGFKLVDNKYLPLVSLAVAAVFVLVPAAVQTKLIIISTIGLSAAGVYELARGKVGAGK
jgi:predicted metal-binding membrane protein